MKKSMNILLCVVSAIFLSSCGKPSHESLAEDMISNVEEMADVLSEVDDVDSAKAAVPKLEKIGEDMKELKVKMDEIGKPSKEVEDELKKKYEDRMEAAMKKMMSAMMSLAAKPEAMKIVTEAMEPMKKTMGSM